MVADLIPAGRNPFEIVLIVAGLMAGITGLLIPGAGSRTIQEILPGYTVAWNVCLVIGAGTAALSLVLKQPLTVLVERVGMIWLSALFTPYGVAVIALSASPASTGGITILGYGLACAARAWQIAYHRRLLRREATAAAGAAR